MQRRRTKSQVHNCTLLITWMWSVAAIAGGTKVPVIGDARLSGNKHVQWGVPTDNYDNTIIISRPQYVVGWDHARRGPAWAAWQLSKTQLGSVGRSETFRLDHDLQDYLSGIGEDSVKPDDYKASCLDRGHQVPSGDRTAILADNQATFYMSNMLPQSAYLNRRTWGSLETFFRTLVTEQGYELSIYVGTVYTGDGTIGPDGDIQVPTKNFKIAVIKAAGRGNVPTANMRVMVVDFPNLTSKGTDPVKDQTTACYDSQHTMRLGETDKTPFWRSYVTNLSRVENESGLNFSFLHQIPAITSAEIDKLIGARSKFTSTFPNMIQILDDAIEEIHQ